MVRPSKKVEEPRQRRCIVTGDSLDARCLIRFVIGPEGQVVPDLAAKLPGRGLWVTGRREVIERAAEKALFARAAGQKCEVSQNLGREVAALLRIRALDSLGLARRAGAIVQGFEKIVTAAEKGSIAALIVAQDGSEDSRRKLVGKLVSKLSQGAGQKGAGQKGAGQKGAGQEGRGERRNLIVVTALDGDELSLALGRPNVVHAALKAGPATDKMAKKLLADLARLEEYDRPGDEERRG